MTPLAYRHAAAPDMPFVVGSFLASYRDAHAAGLVAVDDWYTIMGPQLVKVLARPGGETWVAFHPGETDHTSDLYGWIAVEHGHRHPVVVYLFVKHAFRRMGIARGLFAAAGVDPMRPFAYACKTGVVTELKPYIPRAWFDPLTVRFPRRDDESSSDQAAAGSHRAQAAEP